MGWLKRWLTGGRGVTDRMEYEAQIMQAGWVTPEGASGTPSSAPVPGRATGTVSTGGALHGHEDLLERVYRHQDC